MTTTELEKEIKEIILFHAKDKPIVNAQGAAADIMFMPEIKSFIAKAQKWDALDAELLRFYPESEFDDDDDESEEEPEHIGDLGDIGEVAARHFGYL